MKTFRLCLFASLLALGACSATPVPIPFADGGLPTRDAPNTGIRDAGTSGDALPYGRDTSPGPIPCDDGGDATCGDAGLTDAVGEGPFDGGLEGGATDAIHEGAVHEDGGHEGMGHADKGHRDARHQDAGRHDTLSPDL